MGNVRRLKMKAKVILWDFDGKGRSWLANEAELLHIELLDYIEKDKSFNLSALQVETNRKFLLIGILGLSEFSERSKK